MNNDKEGNDVGVDDTYGENLVKYAVKNFHAYLPGKARKGIQKYRYCEHYPWGIGPFSTLFRAVGRPYLRISYTNANLL